MVNIKNLSLTLPNLKTEKSIIKNINFYAKAGEIIILAGKSGSGKTTTLRCIAGLENNFNGSISINNQEIKALKSEESSKLTVMVFQGLNLFPHLTALENCIKPLIITNKFKLEEAKTIAINVLKKLDMEEFVNEHPSKLSGGQQQRIAITRALCLNPKVILLDEPTSALDPQNSLKLKLILKKISQTGITIIISSQDMNFLNIIEADRVYFMKNGEITQTFEQSNKEESDKNRNILSFLKPHLFD